MYEKYENNAADRALVDRVLGGDTDAFRIILKNTEVLVTQIIFKMIPNSEDRKDIVQDIYVKTFQNLASFKYNSKLSTWVARITYNTCINYLRKKKLIFPDNHEDYYHSTNGALEILSSKTERINSETEESVFKKELSEILKIEIGKLSPVYGTLITLYHNEELSYSEIAQITDLPEGTVKNYLFRARKALRDNILLAYKKDEL